MGEPVKWGILLDLFAGHRASLLAGKFILLNSYCNTVSSVALEGLCEGITSDVIRIISAWAQRQHLSQKAYNTNAVHLFNHTGRVNKKMVPGALKDVT